MGKNVLWVHWISSELLLFASVWFLLVALDDIVVDLFWIRIKLGEILRKNAIPSPDHYMTASHQKRHAIFIPAWQEANVIGDMINWALHHWKNQNFTLFIGVYANDPDTKKAALCAAQNDPRIVTITARQFGPSTKADCLNGLWQALPEYEQQHGCHFDHIILHDAEDIVHPDELALYAHGLSQYDLVQLPVMPIIPHHSPFIAGHYADEFAEAHSKDLVVRSHLCDSIPTAGVGCAVSRDMLEKLAAYHGHNAPFNSNSLTEDYELGIAIARFGGRGTFIRTHDKNGDLIAVKSCFPDNLPDAVRQKGRWTAGIALIGWDNLGWRSKGQHWWMLMRDRRALLNALALTCGYGALLLLGFSQWIAPLIFGNRVNGFAPSPALYALLLVNGSFLLWRLCWRCGFATAHYGWRQGILSILRMITSNIIAILSARRSLSLYVHYMIHGVVSWDKTRHYIPSFSASVERIDNI